MQALYASSATTKGVCSFDPCSLAHWRERPLHYSFHAQERAKERELPIVEYLPDNARLFDVDKDSYGQVYAVAFKVGQDEEGYSMVITNDGTVITLFRNTKKEFMEYHRRKQHRRRRESRCHDTLLTITC